MIKISEQLKNLPHSQEVSYDYILTKSEETAVISHEIERRMKAAAMKMAGLGFFPQQVEIKLKGIDFKSEIDEQELLNKANIRKHWKLEEIESLNKMRLEEMEVKEQIRSMCDANYFFRIMANSFRAEGRRFIQDEFSNPYIKLLCFFMSNDERFFSELDLDLNKGLWLIGEPGIGKTRLIEAVSKNELGGIKIVSMLEVADSVQNSGEFNLGYFEKVLLDDVGSEQHIITHYGTKINWLKDFLELYYAKRQAFNRLLVTTNCDFKEIEDKYGYRVRSRVREMFNVVVVKGTDRRK